MKIQFLKNKKYWFVVVALVVLLVALFVISNMFTQDSLPKGQIIESQTNETGWKTYINSKYNFQIDFPDGWNISETEEGSTPIINIYKMKFNLKPPFDHFSDVDAISIFPQGIETEALIGEVVESDLQSDQPIENKRDYVLDNGEVWATYITFTKVPGSWRAWGSVWARTQIKEVEFSCIRDEEKILIEKCNPFGGDIFIRSGSVNQKIVDIQRTILESFKFIKD